MRLKTEKTEVHHQSCVNAIEYEVLLPSSEFWGIVIQVKGKKKLYQLKNLRAFFPISYLGCVQPKEVWYWHEP